MYETKVRRVHLDDVQHDPMFGEALRIWEATVGGAGIAAASAALSAICDPATNLFHSDMNANSVLAYKVKTLRQAFDLRQSRGEEIGNYPDAAYIDSVLAPNYTAATNENAPIFRRIMTPMVGTFAIYEGILLPYFDQEGRNALSLSRLLYLADGVELTEPVTLTNQEARCLEQLAKGLSAKQIAYALKISERTVEHHIEHIKLSLGVSNGPHAVAKGIFALGMKGRPQAQNDAGRSLWNLTVRERQCLSLLTSGHPAKAIAEAISVSAKTVEKHLRGARVKLGAKNAVDLVAKGAAVAVSALDEA